jgi:hypothetical protein
MTTDEQPAAYPRSLRGLICRAKGHLRPVVAWYCLGESCCSRKCRRCGAPNVAIIDPSGHP